MKEKIKKKEKKRILKRNEIARIYCWDIDSLYISTEEWEKDCQKAEQLRNRFLQLKEKFTKDSQTFLQCLQLKDELSELIQKIFTTFQQVVVQV